MTADAKQRGTAGSERALYPGELVPALVSDAGEHEACGEWLRKTLNRAIVDHRPRVPGWGLLRPHEIVGEYCAESDYLLLVFDHQGRLHTRRFSEEDIHRLKATDRAEAHCRSLIESLCSGG